MRNTLSIHELPEAEQEEIRKFMEAALIVCVDRAGGRLRIPVAEIVHQTTLSRHGKALRRRIDQVRLAAEQAREIEKTVKDDGESIAFSTLVQCQVKLHQIAMATENGDVKEACQQARALADLTRAGISLRRERKLGRQEAVKAVDRKLATAVEDAAKGVDPVKLIRRVRSEMYGIVDD